MKKSVIFSLLLLASCSRAVTPDMLSRSSISKSGTSDAPSAPVVAVDLEAAYLGKSGSNNQANLADISSRKVVRFDADNGTEPKHIYALGVISPSLIPHNPTKQNCKFKGWGTKKDDPSSIVDLSSYYVSADTTLYAQYDLYNRPVTVKVYLNGGVTQKQYKTGNYSNDWYGPRIDSQVVSFQAYTNMGISEFFPSSLRPIWPDPSKVLSCYRYAYNKDGKVEYLDIQGDIDYWSVPDTTDSVILLACVWKDGEKGVIIHH